MSLRYRWLVHAALLAGCSKGSAPATPPPHERAPADATTSAAPAIPKEHDSAPTVLPPPASQSSPVAQPPASPVVSENTCRFLLERRRELRANEQRHRNAPGKVGALAVHRDATSPAAHSDQPPALAELRCRSSDPDVCDVVPITGTETVPVAAWERMRMTIELRPPNGGPELERSLGQLRRLLDSRFRCCAMDVAAPDSMRLTVRVGVSGRVEAILGVDAANPVALCARDALLGATTNPSMGPLTSEVGVDFP